MIYSMGTTLQDAVEDLHCMDTGCSIVFVSDQYPDHSGRMLRRDAVAIHTTQQLKGCFHPFLDISQGSCGACTSCQCHLMY